jgi:DNA invertase Pin-like site-specific DNA recombinase
MTARHPGAFSTPPDGRPVAYGYLRLAESDKDQLAALRLEIAAFCETAALLLVNTFYDRGYDGSEMARPGFAGLLDVLALPESTRLVVPDLLHLSPVDVVRQGLLRQVQRTGVSVVSVRQLNGNLDSSGVADRSTWIGRADRGERT